jgi:hypothetical protein
VKGTRTHVSKLAWVACQERLGIEKLYRCGGFKSCACDCLKVRPFVKQCSGNKPRRLRGLDSGCHGQT